MKKALPMDIVYIVILLLVTGLLLGIPFFPFWKVWRRLATHHPKRWAESGPFDLRTMMAHPSVISAFMDIVRTYETDPAVKKRDPVLVKWARWSREVLHMAPRSFLAQIGYALVFIYFVSFFTSRIMALLQ